MPTRLCLSCGQPTSKPSRWGRCPECQGKAEQARSARAIYDSPRWRALRRRVLGRWIATRGWWCPGWGRAAHEARDLTVDHGEPLALGGDPYDERQLSVLCRECNGRKAARRQPATSKERSDDGNPHTDDGAAVTS